MDARPYFVSLTQTIREAMETCSSAGGIALVVEADGRLKTTLTDGDARRGILDGISPEDHVSKLVEHKRKHLGSLKPVTAPVGTTSKQLLELFRAHTVRNIPLLNEAGVAVELLSIENFMPQTERPVRAVIMAGGFGKRLHPLTNNTPKPMLPVAGKPMLQRTIEQLRDAGIHQINITTHYLPEKITQHFGCGKDFGVELSYVSEDQPLGTAGSLGLLQNFEEPLIVMNGDILTCVDLNAMLDFHREQQAVLTVGVRHYQVEVPYGVINASGGIVHSITEKPTFDWFVNAGVYILQPEARRVIPQGQRYDMPDVIETLLASKQNVASFPVIEYWLDIGQPDDFKRAQQDALKMKVVA